MRTTPCSRRDFLARTTLAGLALSQAQTQTRGRAVRAATAANPSGPYIDVHTHIGRTWNPDPPLTPDALVKWMDVHHVAKAVVLPLVSPESSSYLNLTEQALEAAQRFPERLVPFCCIDPRTSYTGGRSGLRALLKEYVDKGAKGFGEHKVGLPIDHPKMMAVYEVCDDLKLPTLFHMDTQRGTDVPGLPGLETVLKSFPGVQFIGHGPGFWASISGELTARELGAYPVGPVKPGGALDRLFDHYSNLWGDLSAGSGAGALSRDLAFAQKFLIRRADRILFGTDYLKEGQKVPQFELMANFDLPPEVRVKIERANAAKLLGLRL